MEVLSIVKVNTFFYGGNDVYILIQRNLYIILEL